MPTGGSAYARAAEDALAGWRIFRRASVDVVSVAPATAAWRSPAGAGLAAQPDREWNARPHGHHPVLLGSVARNVMLHAACSVLVVRGGSAGEPADGGPSAGNG